MYLIISYNRICKILHLSAKFVYLFFDFRDEPDPRSKILRVTYWVSLLLSWFDQVTSWSLLGWKRVAPVMACQKKQKKQPWSEKNRRSLPWVLSSKIKGTAKWKQIGNNNRWPWQLYTATMRKSKYNLKPAGSSVNRGRLNCKKNDEKRKKKVTETKTFNSYYTWIQSCALSTKTTQKQVSPNTLIAC